MLQASDLRRTYGRLTALDGASISVQPGEVAGLLGPNGAGKSTLMRILAGVLPPDSGRVEIDGISLWSEPVRAKQRLGFAPEEPSLYEELGADEHLAFVATLRALEPQGARERSRDLLERLGLASRARDPEGRYSHGMRKKLSFAIAVLHRPAVLLCDEALEGFDVAAAAAAKDELRALAHAGCAVLFSSHVTETVERTCDRVVIIDRGRVVRSLSRADWGGEPRHRSPLDEIFLSVTREGTETKGRT
jgi:ABC-2 type transport system ATP-binding protein